MFAARHAIKYLRSNARLAHTLPELPYEYKALEPIISAEIMCLHHSKHHATYVNNYNVAEEKLRVAQEKCDTTTIIALAPALRFNGGGHLNHSIFWQNLTPRSTAASPQLCEALQHDFGGMEPMKRMLSAAAVGVQGSGWGWLALNPASKRLCVASCANQDPLQATTGLVPLFGIDVWEHAYYLQYKNVRADYVNAIFDVANWEDISRRYADALTAAC